MKQVRNALGRLVQRLASKSRAEQPEQPAQPVRPQDLDAKALSQVSGGDGGSTQTPRLGW